jgi:serine/threonine protein kinase
MDKVRAKRFEKELVGQTVSGWNILSFINFGKSALVFKAQRADRTAAIKFFDPEIIEKYGAEIQIQRIEREKSLIGKKHPNLVEIFDGGHWQERDLYYVVMEYLPWKNLAEVLSDVPVGQERSIISQVAAAARFLEGLSLCHRDIKPENIAISVDFREVKLLDFGVLRPHGTKTITDGTQGKIFIGTLKYSPPEFLLREEQDTPEGWRAITFYQLGAVLHDLIMRRALFADYEDPYARLVNAVQHTTPKIESKSVSPALVELARYCLLKPVAMRLQLVSWEQFEKEPAVTDGVADLKSRIVRRIMASKTEQKEGVAKRHDTDQRLNEYATDLQGICRLECGENRNIFPPVEVRAMVKSGTTRQFAVQFEPSKAHGLSRHLRIELTASWVDSGSEISEVRVAAIASSKPFSAKQPAVEKTTGLFKGIYAPDTIRRSVEAVLYRALDRAQQITEAEMDLKKNKTGEPVHQLDLSETSSEETSL